MAETPPPGTPDRDPHAGGPETLLSGVQAVLQELPGLLSDRVELFALELQRAGRALAQIVALIVAFAILGVTAWLLAWVGIIAGLMALGLPGWAAVGLALVLNVAAGWAAFARLKTLLPLLRLPATRRHMTKFSPDPVAAPADTGTERHAPPSGPPGGQPAAAAGAR